VKAATRTKKLNKLREDMKKVTERVRALNMAMSSSELKISDFTGDSFKLSIDGLIRTQNSLGNAIIALNAARSNLGDVIFESIKHEAKIEEDKANEVHRG
jgi:hypothetical protein